MGHASQLLYLHRECLARFEAVILSKRLVEGRKCLSLFIEVPVYNAEKKEAKKRKEKGEGQEEEAGKEEVEGWVSSFRFPHRAACPCQARLATWLV